jgi:hypothetical protein
MDATDLLIRKSNEYAQRAAHHAEIAELPNPGEIENLSRSDELTALGYTLVAIALREVAAALMEAEELAA